MTIATSKIYLDEMHFYAYHGVMEQERLVGGEYRVSLTVEADLTEAFVVHVILHLSEDRFGFYGTVGAVLKPPF